MATKKRVVKIWSSDEEKLFRRLIKEGTPTSRIAKQLKRSAASVRSKAQKHGLSLKPKRKAGGRK